MSPVKYCILIGLCLGEYPIIGQWESSYLELHPDWPMGIKLSWAESWLANENQAIMSWILIGQWGSSYHELHPDWPMEDGYIDDSILLDCAWMISVWACQNRIKMSQVHHSILVLFLSPFLSFVVSFPCIHKAECILAVSPASSSSRWWRRYRRDGQRLKPCQPTTTR